MGDAMPESEYGLAALVALLWFLNLSQVRRAWRDQAWGVPRWGWISTAAYNGLLTVTLTPCARAVARTSGHDGAPLLLAQLGGTLAPLALGQILTLPRFSPPGERPPWVLRSPLFGVLAAVLQVATFLVTPRAIGTFHPHGITTIFLPYRVIFGAYSLVVCLALAWLAARSWRRSIDWSLRGGYLLQVLGWVTGGGYNLLYALAGLTADPFGLLHARAARPLAGLLTLLLLTGHLLPRLVRWRRAVAVFHHLWPLWARLLRGCAVAPLDSVMVRRGDPRLLWRPQHYVNRLRLDIADRCADRRLAITPDELTWIAAQLAQAGLDGPRAAAVRDATCIRLVLTRQEARWAGGAGEWRLGAGCGEAADAVGHLTRVRDALDAPLTDRLVRALTAGEAVPDDGEQDHHGAGDAHRPRPAPSSWAR